MYQWRGMLLAAAMLLPGCADRDVANAVAPIAGSGSSLATYAGSSGYGDYYEVDGEVLPAGYAHPWDAVISGQRSYIDVGSGCSGSSCTVLFNAYMSGLWHTTEQVIHWSVADQSGDPVKTNFAPWVCTVRVGLACMLAERTDTHEVTISGHCSWLAKLHSDHAAWWGAWFDLEIFGKKIGQIGRTDRSSIAADRDFDDCSASGGGGTLICYDYYLVWNDEFGHHEIYLGTECDDEM